jgi:predicted amidohydrolase YtcJ
VYDSLFTNANIITVDEKNPRADWVAVQAGKIAQLGTGAPPEQGAKKHFDLGGGVMLPGLYDAHCHVMPTGFFLASVNLLGAKTLDEVFSLIADRVKNTPKGEWVLAGGFMSVAVEENRWPTKDELDKISTEHPIFVAAQTLHGGALNTPAVEKVSVFEEILHAPDFDGTILSDELFFPVMSDIMGLLERDVLSSFIEVASNYAASKGCTSVVALLGQFVTGDIDVDIVENNKGKYAVDFTTFWQTWDIDDIKKYDLKRIGGCLTLDGAGFEYTMANSFGYKERPWQRGFLIHTDEEIYSLLSEAHRQDIQVAFHALGDRAIDQLLGVFKQVIGEQGQKDLRHRVEHFSLAWEDQMDLLAELNLVASMQPAFSGLWGEPETGFYDALFARKYAAQMELFPEIIKRGGMICGGSDSPVTLIDPLFGIASMANNPDPRRNVSVEEAIKAFTINAAFSVHKDKETGSIEIGKDADFTVIDRNPYDCADSKDIYEMETLKTIRGGNVTYER